MSVHIQAETSREQVAVPGERGWSCLWVGGGPQRNHVGPTGAFLCPQVSEFPRKTHIELFHVIRL